MIGPGGSRSNRVSSPPRDLTSNITRTIPRARPDGSRISRERWKESQLQKGALEVYPVCEWGAIERVQALGNGKIIGLDTTARTGAMMVRKDSKVKSLADLRNMPIAVTWHAGTFYAAIEVLEAAGVPFDEIKLVHANDRLDALLSGKDRGGGADGAAGQPRAEAGARKIADLRWRGGIVAGDDVDDETAAQAEARAQPRRRNGCARTRTARAKELLRDLKPEQRKTGMMPELLGVQGLPAEGIPGEGRLDDGPRLPRQGAAIRRGGPQIASGPYPATAARSRPKQKAPGEDAPGAKSRQGKVEDGDEAFPPEATTN